MEPIRSVENKSNTMLYLAIGMTIFVILAFGSAAIVQPVRIERYFKPWVIMHIISSLAWLILLDRNPLNDIVNTLSINTVFKAGKKQPRIHIN